MNSKYYNVNYKRLVLMLLPTMLRKPLLVAFANAMVSQIGSLYNKFLQYQKDINYRLYHNGQTCYLRAVLNDAFDPIGRRITVADGNVEGTSVFIYQRQEGKFKIIKYREKGLPLKVSRRGFSGTTGSDFFINIPTDLKVNIDFERLIAVTNIYKLASKQFDTNFR